MLFLRRPAFLRFPIAILSLQNSCYAHRFSSSYVNVTQLKQVERLLSFLPKSVIRLKCLQEAFLNPSTVRKRICVQACTDSVDDKQMCRRVVDALLCTPFSTESNILTALRSRYKRNGVLIRFGERVFQEVDETSNSMVMELPLQVLKDHNLEIYELPSVQKAFGNTLASCHTRYLCTTSLLLAVHKMEKLAPADKILLEADPSLYPTLSLDKVYPLNSELANQAVAAIEKTPSEVIAFEHLWEQSHFSAFRKECLESKTLTVCSRLLSTEIDELESSLQSQSQLHLLKRVRDFLNALDVWTEDTKMGIIRFNQFSLKRIWKRFRVLSLFSQLPNLENAIMQAAEVNVLHDADVQLAVLYGRFFEDGDDGAELTSASRKNKEDMLKIIQSALHDELWYVRNSLRNVYFLQTSTAGLAVCMLFGLSTSLYATTSVFLLGFTYGYMILHRRYLDFQKQVKDNIKQHAFSYVNTHRQNVYDISALQKKASKLVRERAQKREAITILKDISQGLPTKN
ncbi:meiotically upregulated Mug99 [Schizosaccharomyces japonicus yFS275]|uniref:Meiotically upregulated Mug99 n=1 Tax=Schizosaccharomyces japonicus (strain yFS275 / FY16936) TaxID=402676 RepID=B6K3U1_SCHJY|nr:meiotically upregulated Mug99 [Schizosaccharomyces japonicus yFS275]EEB08148.1 meiotically upregulated Mug99 [Schizosaccharomyces japonicus yFS275]